MGRITSSGCARNDRITRDFVQCDTVVPGAATRRDPDGSSGCARNDRITRDEFECDRVVPGAATRRDPNHQIKLLKY